MMDKDEARRREGRTICVWFPQKQIDWMDMRKADGDYLHYAEMIREGLVILKKQDEGDVFVSSRRRDY